MYETEFYYVFKMLHLVGMHPLEKMRKPFVIFNFTLTFYVTVLIALRVFLSRDLVAMESVGVFCQLWLKFIVLTTKRRQIKRVIEDSQKFWSEKIEGSDNEKLLGLLNRSVKMFLVYIFISTCMFIFKPLLDKGTTIYYYYQIEQIPFMVSYAIEFYVTIVTMLMVISCNLLISITIVIGAGQFCNLNANLRQLEALPLEGKDDLDKMIKKINFSIEYHDFLITYIKRLDDIFSMLFVILISIITALLCMNMYVLTLPNTTYVDLIRCGAMVCAFNIEFLGLYGIPAQTLTDEAAEIGNSAFYHCKWYLPNNIPLRKSLIMIVNRSQKSVCLSAAGFIDMNKQTILFMLKTAYSFYTFLQTVQA